MAVKIAPPRPDLAAHREALSLAWPEIVRRLIEIAGRKLTAYITGVKDARTLGTWIKGTEPLHPRQSDHQPNRGVNN